MRINSRWVYLDNQKSENLQKMYEWSKDKELIESECGNLDNIKTTIEEYDNTIMKSYIENNHERGSAYCHFGIYSMKSDELVGYIDFQDIKENLESSEISLSIPDKINRNKLFGIDSLLVALKYAFTIKNIKNIIIRTNIKNEVVLNIGKRLARISHIHNTGGLI